MDRRWLLALTGIWLLVSLGLIVWSAPIGIVSIGVLIGAQSWITSALRQKQARLQILWTLADELEYRPEKLRQLAGRYSEAAWAATRGERLQRDQACLHLQSKANKPG